MPASKQTLSRYRVINSCFTSRLKKLWSLPELLDQLNQLDIVISRRTLEADLEAMRHDERLGYKAPIVYDRKRRAYQYQNELYSITQFQLTQNELRTLIVIRDLAANFNSLTVMKGYDAIFDKIIAHFDPDELLCSNNQNCIKLTVNINPDIKDMINLIMMAVYEKQVLQISLKTCPQQYFTFHPFLLSNSANSWHVFGLHGASIKISVVQLEDVSNILISEEYVG